MADNDHDVIDLWQNQTSERFRMSQKEMQMRLQTLETKIRTRTRSMYLVCAFLIVSFSTWAVVEHDLLMRLGCVATIIAIAFLGLQVHRNRFATTEASATATPTIEHLRRELQRQADFHRGKRFWSRMLLLAPAGLFFFIAFAQAHPEVIWMIRFEIATFIVMIIAAIPLNLRAAKRYQKQVDELLLLGNER